jgi:hypothetical protein
LRTGAAHDRGGKMTESDVRRIVREEFKRFAAATARQRQLDAEFREEVEEQAMEAALSDKAYGS